MNMNVRRVIAAGTATALTVAGLAACTPNKTATTGSGSWDFGSTTKSSGSAKTVTSTTGVKPAYAYLGYGNIENCKDLATIASGKYYALYDYYSVSTNDDGSTGTDHALIEMAQDGIDFVSMESDDDGATEDSAEASVNGTYMYIDYASKQYLEYDNSDTYEADKKDYEDKIKENDDSDSELTFVKSGKEVLPIQTADTTTEYTYYEYKGEDEALAEDEALVDDEASTSTDENSTSTDEKATTTQAAFNKDGEVSFDDEYGYDDEYDYDGYGSSYDDDYGYPNSDLGEGYDSWTERVYVDEDGNLVAHYFDYGDWQYIIVYKQISSDIPADMLKLPDVSGFTKLEY